MTCIIVEDQPHAQGILERYIGETDTLDLLGTFGDALAARRFLNEQSVDLIFLDIHLPKLSGIDLVSLLSPQPKIIFTTAFSEYALQGYELDAVDYLLKPFSFTRYLQAVSKAERLTELGTDKSKPEAESKTSPPNEIIFIKSGSDYIRIEKTSIKYVKADGDYTWVFTKATKHLANHSLRYWLQHLPDNHFCQIHKSYLVNVRFIEKISNNQIYIDSDKLPIGRTFKRTFFTNYLDEDSSRS